MPSGSTAELKPIALQAWLALLTRFVLTPQFEPPVRRKHRRYAVDLGSWRILYHRGRKPVERHVKLLNAARNGVMLLSREPVPERVPLLLAFTHEDELSVLTGQVMHCTSTVGGYKVGVRLQFEPSPGNDD